MCRFYTVAALFIFAGELLGGCTQTQVVAYRDLAQTKPVSPLPTTLPPGARDGIGVTVRLVLLNDATIAKLPLEWQTSVVGTMRQAHGSPDQVAAQAGEPHTFKTATADDAAIAKLLASVQSDRTTVTMATPPLALVSGQPAKLLSGAEERNYVKRNDHTTSTAPNGNALITHQMEIETLRTGMQLDLTATANDAGQIATTIHQNISRLDGIDTFSAPLDGYVQLPHVTATDLTATASVADGQTLILVGPKISGESEVISKVPLLGDMPGIGGAFSNRSYIKDERTLVLLVRTERIAPSAAAPTPAPTAALPDPALRDLVYRDPYPRQTAKQIRDEKVASLLADGCKLYDKQQWNEAQTLFREATIIDPQNESAALMLKLASTKIVDRDYDAIQHRAGVEISPQHVDSDEHLIPYNDLIVYPDNTPELTRRRAESK